MQWFTKELPDAAVWIAGAPLKFEFLETADPVLIRELESCIARGVGGIIKITQEQYEEGVKKKPNGNPSGSNSRPRLQRQELSALHARHVAEVVNNGQFSGFKEGTFASPQGRGAAPVLPVSGRPMPDPIQIPSPNDFKGVFTKPPPTAKAIDINGGKPA